MTKKTYSLKEQDTNLLIFMARQRNDIIQNAQAIMSGVLSSIASDKLGYKVTENTQFKLSDDYKTVEVTEVAPEASTEQPGTVAAE